MLSVIAPDDSILLSNLEILEIKLLFSIMASYLEELYLLVESSFLESKAPKASSTFPKAGLYEF